MTRITLRRRATPDGARPPHRTEHLPRRVRLALIAGLVAPAALACGPRQAAQAPAPERVFAYAPSATGVLTARELGRQRATRVEELLSGRVAGVQVLPLANGDYAIRIRGTRSIYGSNEPLVVLDGMPLENGAGRGALNGINPADVVRIEVLKDAASTAWYGMRGANGVIVITTRR